MGRKLVAQAFAAGRAGAPPAMSTNSTRGRHHLSADDVASDQARVRDRRFTPTFGSMVQNGKFAAAAMPALVNAR